MGPASRSSRSRCGIAAAALWLTTALPATTTAQERVHLAVDVGFDGMVLRGGVAPIYAVIRLPGDAAPPLPGHPWLLRLTPSGGPTPWALVLPLTLLPGSPQIVDTALPLHPEDVALTAVLTDPAGAVWATVQRGLTALPQTSELALFLGDEHGVRRVREEATLGSAVAGSAHEVTWIRLPPQRLPTHAECFHDVARIAWDPDAPPQFSAAVEHALEQWAHHYGRPLGARAPREHRPVQPPRGLSLELARLAAGTLARPATRPVGPVMAAAAVGMFALGALARRRTPRPRRPKRVALAAACAALALWLALGAPIAGARLRRVLQLRERAAGCPPREWVAYAWSGATAGAPRADWPRENAAWVAPVWASTDAQGSGWEVWNWEPGTGDRRWMIQAPRRGARAVWLDFQCGESLSASNPLPPLTEAETAADRTQPAASDDPLAAWQQEAQRAVGLAPALRRSQQPGNGLVLELTWAAVAATPPATIP